MSGKIIVGSYPTVAEMSVTVELWEPDDPGEEKPTVLLMVDGASERAAIMLDYEQAYQVARELQTTADKLHPLSTGQGAL